MKARAPSRRNPVQDRAEKEQPPRPSRAPPRQRCKTSQPDHYPSTCPDRVPAHVGRVEDQESDLPEQHDGCEQPDRHRPLAHACRRAPPHTPGIGCFRPRREHRFRCNLKERRKRFSATRTAGSHVLIEQRVRRAGCQRYERCWWSPPLMTLEAMSSVACRGPRNGARHR